MHTPLAQAMRIPTIHPASLLPQPHMHHQAILQSTNPTQDTLPQPIPRSKPAIHILQDTLLVTLQLPITPWMHTHLVGSLESPTRWGSLIRLASPTRTSTRWVLLEQHWLALQLLQGLLGGFVAAEAAEGIVDACTPDFPDFDGFDIDF